MYKVISSRKSKIMSFADDIEYKTGLTRGADSHDPDAKKLFILFDEDEFWICGEDLEGEEYEDVIDLKEDFGEDTVFEIIQGYGKMLD